MHHKFSPEFIEKFESRVDRSGGPDACHPWIAGLLPKGYGVVAHTGVPKAHSKRAHVIAFLLSGGVIPDGYEVCHSCDVRACCNPRHLRADTHANNVAERNAKGRYDHGPNAPQFQPHAPRGMRRGEGAAKAKLTEDDVRAIRSAYVPGKRGFGVSSLAKKYGVHDFAIEMIVKRKSWKHID